MFQCRLMSCFFITNALPPSRTKQHDAARRRATTAPWTAPPTTSTTVAARSRHRPQRRRPARRHRSHETTERLARRPTSLLNCVASSTSSARLKWRCYRPSSCTVGVAWRWSSAMLCDKLLLTFTVTSLDFRRTSDVSTSYRFYR